MDQYRRGELTFDVRDRGPQDGEPVVLLHGFPQDATSFSLVEPALHAAGLRTLAPDQRGYSPGARPPRRSDYASGEVSDDIIALLDAAGLESAHIVGHDWGGAVAWMLAGNHPGRVRSVTALSTPHPGAMGQAWRTSRQALSSWYMVAFQLPWIPEQILSRRLGRLLRRSGLPADSARYSAERFGDPAALKGAVDWYRGMPFARRTPIHRATVPVTYVWGRRDGFLGRTGAELTRNYVIGEYRFVELDAGHWLLQTHPEQVSVAILERVRSVS